MSGELKRKLQKARIALGLTQKQMADKLACPLSTYIKWENDQRTPRGFALVALLQKLDDLKK